MDRAETKKILGEFGAVFPTYYKQDTLKTTVDLWHEAMEAVQYEHAHQAIVSLLQTEDKPPSVAQIIRKAKQISDYERLRKGEVLHD